MSGSSSTHIGDEDAHVYDVQRKVALHALTHRTPRQLDKAMSEGDIEVGVNGESATLSEGECSVETGDGEQYVAVGRARVKLLEEGPMKANNPLVPGRTQKTVLLTTDGEAHL